MLRHAGLRSLALSSVLTPPAPVSLCRLASATVTRAWGQSAARECRGHQMATAAYSYEQSLRAAHAVAQHSSMPLRHCFPPAPADVYWLDRLRVVCSGADEVMTSFVFRPVDNNYYTRTKVSRGWGCGPQFDVRGHGGASRRPCCSS